MKCNVRFINLLSNGEDIIKNSGVKGRPALKNRFLEGSLWNGCFPQAQPYNFQKYSENVMNNN
jgi:hypothetical protein